jgi:hypothetical protein
MDLALYFRVLWRFRALVLAGLSLAVVLTFLSIAKIDLKNGVHISYRKPQTWASTTTLMLTQKGFPVGRATYGGQQFPSLAVLYARIASSDRIKQMIAGNGPLGGEITADASVLPNNPTYPLPLVDITALASNQQTAVRLAGRASRALRTYVSSQQDLSGIPAGQRVVLDQLQRPEPPVLVVGRKKTLPITIFLGVMIATLGLAFILENLRPRLRAIGPAEESSSGRPRDRQSA